MNSVLRMACTIVLTFVLVVLQVFVDVDGFKFDSIRVYAESRKQTN